MSFFCSYNILYNLKLKLQQFDTRKICSLTILVPSLVIFIFQFYFIPFSTTYNIIFVCVTSAATGMFGLLLKVHRTLCQTGDDVNVKSQVLLKRV